jgi:hypothetical protein
LKHITLKNIPKSETLAGFNYNENLTAIMSRPIGGQGGIDVNEMRRVASILDKLEALKDSPTGAPVLVLEDAQWELVKARVTVWPWAMFHKVIVQFVDDIENAPNQAANTDTPKTEN